MGVAQKTRVNRSVNSELGRGARRIKPFDDRSRKVVRLCRSAKVSRQVLAFRKHVEQRLLDSRSRVLFAEVSKHQDRRHQYRSRVSYALTGNIRGRPVHGLEHRTLLADVCTWRETEPADQTGA